MKITKTIDEFYKNELAKHGPSARGVGWKDREAQEIRFQQIIKVIPSGNSFTINDLGCGVGDLLRMLEIEFPGLYTYRGYDALEEMISLAKKNFPENNKRQFFVISDYSHMTFADYTLASGIFNVRNAIDDAAWQSYILETLGVMNVHSSKGFAFNALTRYSDTEYMRPELFYSDPLYLFDYCKKHFSKNVALLHDYGIYDFTILVKKDIGNTLVGAN
jgi:SAM-dependent methyltransferase